MKTFWPLAFLSAAFLLYGCSAQESEDLQNQEQAAAAQQEGNTTEQESGTSAKLKTYVVATTRTYAPFEFKDDDTHQRVGFDIDLLHAIGEKEGITFRFIEVLWEEMRDRIQFGKVDALANGIAITEERKTIANFSDPYLETYGVAFTLADSDIKNIDDLAGKSLCAIKDDYSLSVMNKILDASQYTRDEESTLILCIKKLASRKVDAVVGNVHVSRYYRKGIADMGDIHEIPIPESKNQLGFAVHRKNTELLEKINSGLRKIKEDGTYDRIWEKYFGKVH